MNQSKKKFKLEEPFQDKEIKEPKEIEKTSEFDTKDFEEIRKSKVNEEKEIFNRPSNIKDLHNHNGVNSELIDVINLFGMFETVTSVPTGTPKKLYDQVKIYVNSTSSPTDRRLYIYSNKTKEWQWIRLGSYSGLGTGSPNTNTQAGDVYVDDITNIYISQGGTDWVQVNNL